MMTLVGVWAQGGVEADSFEGGSKSYCNMYQQVRGTCCRPTNPRAACLSQQESEREWAGE